MGKIKNRKRNTHERRYWTKDLKKLGLNGKDARDGVNYQPYPTPWRLEKGKEMKGKIKMGRQWGRPKIYEREQ